jgi:hypothetical protein
MITLGKARDIEDLVFRTTVKTMRTKMTRLMEVGLRKRVTGELIIPKRKD